MVTRETGACGVTASCFVGYGSTVSVSSILIKKRKSIGQESCRPDAVERFGAQRSALRAELLGRILDFWQMAIFRQSPEN